MTRRIARASGGGRLPAAALCWVLALLMVGGAGGRESVSSSQASLVGRAIHPPAATVSTQSLARSAASWTGGVTKAQTGELVNVFVSSALPPDLGTAQSWADFLAGLMHGPELSALTAYIGTFAEMQEICGEHALGCYGANRMVSMGETVFGVTAAEVVRHEYGHHIAFHRVNAPWQAIGWGPKHWASVESVCARAAGGTAFPGDEGGNYALNPGEAWAETYRLLDERGAGASGSGWQIVDSSFFPDEVAFAAAADFTVTCDAGQKAVGGGWEDPNGYAHSWTLGRRPTCRAGRRSSTCPRTPRRVSPVLSMRCA